MRLFTNTEEPDAGSTVPLHRLDDVESTHDDDDDEEEEEEEDEVRSARYPGDKTPKKRHTRRNQTKKGNYYAVPDVDEENDDPRRVRQSAVAGGEEGIRRGGARRFRKAAKRHWCRTVAIVGVVLLLIILLLANAALEIQRQIWVGDDGDDPDAIFADWGRPGTGTEGLAWYPTDFLRDVVPVPCHSHNDYWRRVPLFSALHAGCISVEADVWLLPDDDDGNGGGDLLVGHEQAALQPNRTFRSLYVDPLVDILTRQNPSTAYYNSSRRGVFDTDPTQTLVLLVDVKTDGPATWARVLEQLEPLRARGWLSYFDPADGQTTYRPITAVGTGNTPMEPGPQPVYRDAFFDAPLDKLEEDDDEAGFDATNSYYASLSFRESIGRVISRGGALGATQLDKLRRQVAAAHARGLLVRYWELPPWPIHVRNRVWDLLVREGVDILNVDDLRGAARRDWTKLWPF